MKTALALAFLVFACPAGASTRKGTGAADKSFEKADALLERGSYAAAATLLKNLGASLSPDDPLQARIHERTGAVRLREGKLGEAKKSFAAAIKTAQRLGADDSAAKAYTGMGLCLRREKNDEYALKFFKRALKLDLDEGTRMFVDDQIREIEGDPPVPAR